MDSFFNSTDEPAQFGGCDGDQRIGLRRPGFTLVELLVGISIVGVMAGMVLYALAGAQTDAKIARTRGTIEKINSVILQEWESYRYRAAKINIDNDFLRPQVATGGQPVLSAREGARLRMIVLRDLMRMEMPDRWTDVLYPPVGYKAALFTHDNPVDTGNDVAYYAGNSFAAPSVSPGVRPVPAKLNIYRADLGTAIGVGALSPFSNPTALRVNAIPAAAALTPLVYQNQSAETLYMIVASADYAGGSAMEAFGPSEIGDTDEDGLFEFLDAWGNPIGWIRWPSGYQSPLNAPLWNPSDSNNIPPGETAPRPPSNAGNSDALDPLRTDWRWSNTAYQFKPWLLVPLVVSAGPDEVYDIQFDISLPYAEHVWDGTLSPAHNSDGPYFYPDPYFGSYDRATGAYTGGGVGAQLGSGASDNITNYSLILD